MKVCPTSFKQMLKPGMGYKIGINNNPTEAGAAFAAVFAAALANGGSFNNIKPGVDYFQKLNKEGNFVATVAGPATVQSGATNIVIWWDYLQASEVNSLPGYAKIWKIVIPSDGVVRGLLRPGDQQAAPRTRRLRGSGRSSSTRPRARTCGSRVRPVRSSFPTWWRTTWRTPRALAALPPAPAGVTNFPTQAQLVAAKAVVAQYWPIEVGFRRVVLLEVASDVTVNEAVAFGPATSVSRAGGAGLPRQARLKGLLRGVRPTLAMAPFVIYTFLGLGIPTLAVIELAFRSEAGKLTLSNLHTVSQGTYRLGFENSILLGGDHRRSCRGSSA